MTTQHVPHTPLWRRVIALPQTRLGWLAVGLAGIALALTAFTNVMGFANTDNPELSILGASVSWGGDVLIPLVFLTWSLSGVAGLVVALIALLRGQERSALVWVAMVPGLPALWPLVFTFLVLLDSMGEISKLWGMVALAGLIGVLIVWLQRHREGKQR